jgi:hypothetical protein
LVFKVLQTQSDGTVARWIDAPTPGGEEPANPAAVLTLSSADAPDTASPEATAAAAETATAATSDSTARSIGIAGLVVGILALIAAGIAISRSRSARP